MENITSTTPTIILYERTIEIYGESKFLEDVSLVIRNFNNKIMIDRRNGYIIVCPNIRIILLDLIYVLGTKFPLTFLLA